MDAGRRRAGRDGNGLPTLTLGLSSVRFIIDKLETQFTRVSCDRQIVKYDPNIDDEFDDTPLGPPRGRVWLLLENLGLLLDRCVPSVTLGNFGTLAVLTGLFAPRMISYMLVYPFCRLVFGTLYPAYASYKAVRTKNLKEYVKWMMYWIVFALFTCTETFTDMFFSWFPFYYEVKIVLVLWLLSPATKGSSILYRKFVHPALCRREQEIDEYIAKAKDQGYHTVLNLGTKGVNYATTVIMQTAIKGGGGLVQQLRKSYSLSDLSECDGRDEAADVMAEPQLIRRNVVRSGYNTRRSASESSRSMYFPEVDVETRATRGGKMEEPNLSHIKSSEDISSGYSSADNSGASLSRTASVGAGARVRPRPARTAVTSIKRPPAAEDSEVIIEEVHDDDCFDYTTMPPLLNVSSPLFLSNTNPPFIYQYVGDQIKIIQVVSEPIMNNKDNVVIMETRDQSETLDEKDRLPMSEPSVSKNELNERNPCDEIDLKEFTHLECADISKTNEVAQIVDNKSELNIVTHISTKEITEPTVNEIVNLAEISSQETDVINTLPTSNPTIFEEPKKPLKQSNVDEFNLESNSDNFQESLETASIDTSITENADSDDEASFGTPEASPKLSRKSPKGKYGKGKAPPPPAKDLLDNSSLDISFKGTDDSMPKEKQYLVDVAKESSKKIQANPITKKKQRNKSRSPGKSFKTNSSSIGKLLQLPGKLAFWNKTEKKTDSASITSDDESRRSSTAEIDNFTQFNEPNPDIIDIPLTVTDTSVLDNHADDQISFKDASDFETEITHDIMEKSDALQKLIDAKLESHPEYKVPTIDDFSSASKSTEV